MGGGRRAQTDDTAWPRSEIRPAYSKSWFLRRPALQAGSYPIPDTSRVARKRVTGGQGRLRRIRGSGLLADRTLALGCSQPPVLIRYRISRSPCSVRKRSANGLLPWQGAQQQSVECLAGMAADSPKVHSPFANDELSVEALGPSCIRTPSKSLTAYLKNSGNLIQVVETSRAKSKGEKSLDHPLLRERQGLSGDKLLPEHTPSSDRVYSTTT